MRDITVFSGSAHPQLAAEICAQLEVPLRPVRLQRFANEAEGGPCNVLVCKGHLQP